jgi:type I restriction enzyme S subunit
MNLRTFTLDRLKAPSPYSFVGGPFGSNLTTRDYADSGVPVIRGNNLPMDASFHDDDFVFVSEPKADDLRSNNAYPGDLIFTQRGTLGQVGLIPKDARFPRYVISQSQMKLTLDAELADARFIYYIFRLPETVQKIINRALTSGVPHINLGILRNFEITIPEVPYQRRIAEVLAQHDALIDINRQRISLLQEASHHLYREWFIRRRFPGCEHTATIEGLPEGWQLKKLGEVLTLKRGYDLPDSARVPGTVPVVSSSGITGFHDTKKADGPGVITGRYGTLGEVYFVDRPYWPLNTALYVRDFKGNPPAFIAYFLKHALQSIQSDKAAVPGLNRNVAHALTVLWPAEALRRQFDDFARLTYQQIAVLIETNDKLRAARDLLLPRLVTGKLAA